MLKPWGRTSAEAIVNSVRIHIAYKHQHYLATRRIMPLEQHSSIRSVQKYKHINKQQTTNNKCMHKHEPLQFLAGSQGTRRFLSAVNGNSDARSTQVRIGNGKFFLGAVNGNF